MADPAIICVAITGSVPQKSDNPALPVSISEQIESTHESFEAGASIAHCHVRNADGSTTSDPEKFALLGEGLKKHCPGMIIQYSTGGRSGTGAERGGMLPLKPDMASLTVGSNNFPTRVYENSPELVDWLASDPTASASADFLIIGDLNAYAKEDPINTLQSADYTDLLFDFSGEFVPLALLGHVVVEVDDHLLGAGLVRPGQLKGVHDLNVPAVLAADERAVDWSGRAVLDLLPGPVL